MTEKWDLLIHLPSSKRDRFVERHQFYVEQVKVRLLPQFNDIEAETDRYLAVALEQMSSRPSNNDEYDSDIPEMAYEAACDHYSQITDLKKQILLGSLAGMYHQWDKDLRGHLDIELSRYYNNDWIAKNIWRPSNAIDLLKDLTIFGWDVTAEPFFELIDACNIIINVYKHGKGKSLKLLYDKYPKYLPDPLSLISDYCWSNEIFVDLTWLTVTSDDFDEFSRAIVKFWMGMPERLFYIFPDDT